MTNTKQKELMPFITLFDKDYKTTLTLAKHMINSGINYIKLALPFSDPNVSSDLIIASNKRALVNKIKIDDCLALIKEIKAYKKDVKLSLFAYANNVIAYGVERFMHNIKESGIDALVMPDIPYLMANLKVRFLDLAKESNLSLSFYIMENTPLEVVEAIAKTHPLYIQMPLLKTRLENEETILKVKAIAEILHKENVLFFVNYSIELEDSLQSPIEPYVDGFVMGSAFCRIIEISKSEDELLSYVNKLLNKR